MEYVALLLQEQDLGVCLAVDLSVPSSLVHDRQSDISGQHWLGRTTRTVHVDLRHLKCRYGHMACLGHWVDREYRWPVSRALSQSFRACVPEGSYRTEGGAHFHKAESALWSGCSVQARAARDCWVTLRVHDRFPDILAERDGAMERTMASLFTQKHIQAAQNLPAEKLLGREPAIPEPWRF